MNDLLTGIAKKFRCDKADKNHQYTPLYHKFFESIRGEEINILEFGFGEGSSVKMWLEYFTKAKLFMVDNRKYLPKDQIIQNHTNTGRFKFISADQIDIPSFSKVFKKYSISIIIDDASHVAEDQQYTMGHIFKYLSPGGWYVIEDLKCKRNHSIRFKNQSIKTLNLLELFLSNGKFESKVLTEEQNNYITSNIEWVKIYDKIAFIRKKNEH